MLGKVDNSHADGLAESVGYKPKISEAALAA